MPNATLIRPTAQNLVIALMFDIWPENSSVTDFGIDSVAHLAALQTAVRTFADYELAMRDLDAVLGDGPKITAWVRQYSMCPMRRPSPRSTTV